MILVTGGAGFIGRHVVRKLRAEGARVRVLDKRNWGDAPYGVELMPGNITDPDVQMRALQGVNAVIHLAAISRLWHRQPQAYHAVNALATGELARRAREHHVRKMVYVSSLTTLIAGKPGGKVATLDETIELAPEALLGPYPRAKRLGEILAMAQNGSDFGVVTVLPTLPIGPGDHNLTAPTELVLDLAGRNLPALLETWMNFIDVRDLADAIIAALHMGRSGQRYVLAGEDVKLSQFAHEVAIHSGVMPVSRTVSGWLAHAAALLEEGVLARITGQAPKASLTGVRIAMRARHFDARKAQTELGLRVRARSETLTDMLGDSLGAERVRSRFEPSDFLEPDFVARGRTNVADNRRPGTVRLRDAEPFTPPIARNDQEFEDLPRDTRRAQGANE